jgi:hypothetical protein
MVKLTRVSLDHQIARGWVGWVNFLLAHIICCLPSTKTLEALIVTDKIGKTTNLSSSLVESFAVEATEKPDVLNHLSQIEE